MASHQPSVTITVQPAGIYRFRYKSEIDGTRSLGSILGVPDHTGQRTYPTIRVDGYQGPFVVLLSLVNAHNNFVHPHSILGTDPRYRCKDGVIYIFANSPEVVFNNIGILCVKAKTKAEVKAALEIRRDRAVDPLGAGFEHMNKHRLIDFSAVRLCFQVFLPANQWTLTDQHDARKYNISLPAASSSAIYDARKYNVLKIVYVSPSAGPISGGTEMNLWCDKYTGENPTVVFEDGRGWSQVVTDAVYHKQVAMRFAAPTHPKHFDPTCTEDLTVNVYLQQKTEHGMCRSEPAKVEYLSYTPRSGLGLITPPPPGYSSHIDSKNIDEEYKIIERHNIASLEDPCHPVPGTSGAPSQEEQTPASEEKPPNTDEVEEMAIDMAEDYNLIPFCDQISHMAATTD